MAVAATRRNGTSDSRTNPVPSNPVSTNAAENAATSAISTRRRVASISASGSPVISTSWSRPGTAVTR